jgi:hypothetical protein
MTGRRGPWAISGRHCCPQLEDTAHFSLLVTSPGSKRTGHHLRLLHCRGKSTGHENQQSCCVGAHTPTHRLTSLWASVSLIERMAFFCLLFSKRVQYPGRPWIWEEEPPHLAWVWVIGRFFSPSGSTSLIQLAERQGGCTFLSQELGQHLALLQD